MIYILSVLFTGLFFVIGIGMLVVIYSLAAFFAAVPVFIMRRQMSKSGIDYSLNFQRTVKILSLLALLLLYISLFQVTKPIVRGTWENGCNLAGLGDERLKFGISGLDNPRCNRMIYWLTGPKEDTGLAASRAHTKAERIVLMAQLRKINPDLVLENIYSDSGEVVFQYKLINHQRIEAVGQGLVKQQYSSELRNLCASEEYKEYAGKEKAIKLMYKDKDDTIIGARMVQPEQCSADTSAVSG